MSLSIDLTNLPKRKQRVTLTERQLREAKMENRIAELEQQLAEAQAKAELWEKIEKYFSPILLFSSGKFTDSFWEFSKRIPAEIDESIEDAVRRLP